MQGDALTTVARMKDRLQITVSDFDDLLGNLILGVTARIGKMCNRRFSLAEYTNELHDGSDLHGSTRTVLIAKNAPVHALDTIEYNAGSNSQPDWTAFEADDYDADLEAGLFYFGRLPTGKRNIRITYTGGYDGYSIGIANVWTFNTVPTGTVDGSNRTFTLPQDAAQVIVYADGVRVLSSNVAFTANTDTFTLAVDQAPFSSISVDYMLVAEDESGEYPMPFELTEVCEQVVSRLFNRRHVEGQSSSTLQESTIAWREDVFTAENRATIKNYRRGYDL